MDKIKEAMTEYWGEKCADFDEGCPCCQAWAEFDELVKRLEDKEARS